MATDSFLPKTRDPNRDIDNIPAKPVYDKDSPYVQHSPTSCDCLECTRFCKGMPSFLLPEDIDSLSRTLGVTPRKLAEDYLEVSEGFMVEKIKMKPLYNSMGVNPMGVFPPMPSYEVETVRVPTLVPRTEGPKHHCIFLNENNHCDVHFNGKPFGCSHFDHHMSSAKGNKVARDAMKHLEQDLRDKGGRYMQLIQICLNNDNIAETIETRKEWVRLNYQVDKIKKEMDELGMTECSP